MKHWMAAAAQEAAEVEQRLKGRVGLAAEEAEQPWMVLVAKAGAVAPSRLLWWVAMVETAL
jgi:hypothetical protein